ncbi:MAG TPA: NAD(P)/FAD-dependent oxidoreductase [Candidatus Polarisedimenticolaceae bacterium]|nr:NAD(P)/FAD-dependent oxidoreductase [Candidatus Polarisedimenticolaceae bacterium]
MSARRPRVLVVGAGFGGLRVARALRHAPVDVLLVDRGNVHVFQPLLYQVATAGLSVDNVTRPVRAIFRRQRNVAFRMAEVTGLDLGARTAATPDGPLPWDFLVLAAGGGTNFFGNTGLAAHSLGLKEVEDAVRVRNHVLRRFEQAAITMEEARRRELLTLVLVGGGPTGIELAGALAELAHLVLAREYAGLHPGEIRILLLEMGTRLLPALPEKLGSYALRSLTRKGVEVRFGVRVEGYDGRVVELGGGERLPAGTLLWAAGIRASHLLAGLGLPLGPQGRIPVLPSLQVNGHPQVYAIGDAAYLEQDGQALPMVAQVAMQMGVHAAMNIQRQLRREKPRPFRYRDLGTMATIGRRAAVAHLAGIELTGLVAWIAWLALHVVQLIGYRNRVVVLVNWAWNYLFYDPANRRIGPE